MSLGKKDQTSKTALHFGCDTFTCLHLDRVPIVISTCTVMKTLDPTELHEIFDYSVAYLILKTFSIPRYLSCSMKYDENVAQGNKNHFMLHF